MVVTTGLAFLDVTAGIVRQLDFSDAAILDRCAFEAVVGDLVAGKGGDVFWQEVSRASDVTLRVK